MTVRLGRQMRDLLQTISTLSKDGVCEDEQLISFTTVQRKAIREMQRVPKLPVDQEKLLSALGEALDDYYKVGGPNDPLQPCAGDKATRAAIKDAKSGKVTEVFSDDAQHLAVEQAFVSRMTDCALSRRGVRL